MTTCWQTYTMDEIERQLKMLREKLPLPKELEGDLEEIQDALHELLEKIL